jgi:hypothetical protein
MTERGPPDTLSLMSVSPELEPPGSARLTPAGRPAWRRVLVVTAVLALAGGGCGGGAAVPSANDAAPTGSSGSPVGAGSGTPEQTEGTSAESQDAPAGGGGAIVLNGESHTVEQVISCVVGEDLKDGSLDLAATADSLQLQLLIHVDFSEQLVAVEGDGMEPKVLQSQSVTVQGPAANGLWGVSAAEAVVPPNFSPVWRGDGGAQIDGPPLIIAGDQMSGSMTVHDATGGPDSADLSFEISIPSQPIDCSL